MELISPETIEIQERSVFLSVHDSSSSCDEKKLGGKLGKNLLMEYALSPGSQMLAE